LAVIDGVLGHSVCGWTPLVSVQTQYNLVSREEEREMFGRLADQSGAFIPRGAHRPPA
jgi:aryl-alcohol dehydrogenase-like predicted oxidoreductase